VTINVVTEKCAQKFHLMQPEILRDLEPFEWSSEEEGIIEDSLESSEYEFPQEDASTFEFNESDTESMESIQREADNISVHNFIQFMATTQNEQNDSIGNTINQLKKKSAKH
jgi:hypothetical protein